MLSMYRFMSRGAGSVELEAVIRYQAIDFPATGPSTATVVQKTALAQALEDAAGKEARYGQIVLTTRSTTGGIVAVENLTKRGQPNSLTWLSE